MSDCIEIQSSLGSYAVEFNQLQDAYALEESDSCFYLIDSLVANLHHVSIGSGCNVYKLCLLYTSPSPRDRTRSRMPSSA